MDPSARPNPRTRRPVLLGLIWIGLAVAPAILPALSASDASTATVQDEAGSPPDSIAEAVVEVQASGAPGLGFLVDASGLVMTSALLVRDVEHAVVILDRRGRFLAEVLTPGEKSGIAVLWVNPKVVAGIRPLPFPDKNWRQPHRGETILVAARRTGGEGVALLTGTVLKRRARYIIHDAPLTGQDIGGPVLTTGGVVVGVTGEPRGGRAGPAAATRSLWHLSRLKGERERASMLPFPPARPLAPLAAGASGSGITSQGPEAESGLNFTDYRIRSGKRSIEFLTPHVVQSLGLRANFRIIAGEAPWQWVRLAGVTEPVVVIQVVPDLRWTGGSYFRVAGRVVSYPVLVAASVFQFLAAAFIRGEDPVLFGADLWRPTHAAYHFKGDFLEAGLLRDGLEVPPIEGHRDCATTKLVMARRPTQQSRVRKIRGCWGSYTYPAEAFAPGAALSLRLIEEGREDRPKIVPLPPTLVERIRGDGGPAPADLDKR